MSQSDSARPRAQHLDRTEPASARSLCQSLQMPASQHATSVLLTTFPSAHGDTSERQWRARVVAGMHGYEVAIPHRGGEHVIAVPIAPDADDGRGKSAASSVGAVDLPGAAHRNT